MAGHEPTKEALILTLGADFVHKYQKRTSDPDIPPGTTARIELYANKNTSTTLDIWNASVVDDDEVYFKVESEDTDVIPDRAHYRLYLVFPDTPALDMCWAYGDVTRKQ